MATLNKSIAEEIVRNDGYYYDDPRVFCVIRYLNAWGGESFAVAYNEADRQRYFDPSSYVKNPEVIWEAK